MNQSIHPRVVGKTIWYVKVNISKQAKPGSKDGTISNIEKHLEQHPTDQASRSYLAKLKSR